MENIERSIELEFTFLDFYSDFVVARVKEGVVFTKKNAQDLVDVCAGHFENESFVYISHRLNNYTVDPTLFVNLEEATNLAGTGFVTDEEKILDIYSYRKTFGSIPFKIFIQLEEAISWAREILSDRIK